MKLTVTSDLHGKLIDTSEIAPCDVLCICGDIVPLAIQNTYWSSIEWWGHTFVDWCKELINLNHAKHIVFIGGNHDFACEVKSFRAEFEHRLLEEGLLDKVHYLQKSSVIIDGVKFYGCPCSDIYGWAFHAKNYADYLPEANTDVMLVHQAPSFGGLGTTILNGEVRNFGSRMLDRAIAERTPSYLFCGHIHDGTHTPIEREFENGQRCFMANCSRLGEDYFIHHKPLQVTI